MTDRTLVVMARPLVRGAVKTRLARAIGDDGALALYERLLDATLDAAEQVPGAALVLAEPRAQAEPAADPLAGRSARWTRLPQRGDGLAERLAGVFADLFAAGAGAVVAVNSDSPALPAEYLEQAFEKLVGDELVLGPAADGGYYLIGAGRTAWGAGAGSLPPLLKASPMSSPRLLDHTLRAARDAGLRVAQLPLWVDVDEPADLGVRDRLEGRAPSRGEPGDGLREVYLHVTHRCGRACKHCYDDGLARRRAHDRRVARRDRPVRRARRRELRLHRRGPAGPRRLRRAGRPRDRCARGEGAVLLQQPRRREDWPAPSAGQGEGCSLRSSASTGRARSTTRCADPAATTT